MQIIALLSCIVTGAEGAWLVGTGRLGFFGLTMLALHYIGYLHWVCS